MFLFLFLLLLPPYTAIETGIDVREALNLYIIYICIGVWIILSFSGKTEESIATPPDNLSSSIR